MSCQTFAQGLADLPSITSNFRVLIKNELIEKVRKALKVCSSANIVINRQNNVIIKYMMERLKTGISLMDCAIVPAPVCAPTSASVPASSSANK